MKTLIACALTALACAGLAFANGVKPLPSRHVQPVKQVLVCAFTGSTSAVEVGGTATGMICVSRPTK